MWGYVRGGACGMCGGYVTGVEGVMVEGLV